MLLVWSLVWLSEGQTSCDGWDTVHTVQWPPCVCGIPLVLFKVVLRIGCIPLDHESISRNFGKDGCGGNRIYFGVALNDRLGCDGEYRGHAIAIDKHKVGLNVQGRDSEDHGFEGGLENVDLINTLGAVDMDGIVNLGMRRELLKQSFSLCFIELFTVVHAYNYHV
jgi:hypothetical protein